MNQTLPRYTIYLTYTYSTLFLNLAFLVQAYLFNWSIGTMVWIYWLEGLIIGLVGLIVNFKRKQAGASVAYVILLFSLGFFWIFMISLTFPMESGTYRINGEQVAPEEFTAFVNTDWYTVLANCLIILIGTIISFRKGDIENLTVLSMFLLIKKIVPITIIILTVLLFPWPTILFVVLKAVLDFDFSLEKKIKSLNFTLFIADFNKLLRNKT